MSTRPLSRDEVRQVDRRAIEEYGIPGVVLMENAGRGTAELLMSLGINGPVVICAGKGNNGGDGFVIARHLENQGCPMKVLLFADPDELDGDAAINYRVIRSAGTPIDVLSFKEKGKREKEKVEFRRRLADADWIVDALLGTGARGSVREPYAAAIRQINASTAKVLAVDLPSGMDCDTGEPLGCCVRADHTATFVARKAGFDAAGAEKLTGSVRVIDIGVPRALLEAGPSRRQS